MEFDGQFTKDPFFRKIIALKKIFMKFSSKAFIIKDEKEKYQYEIESKI